MACTTILVGKNATYDGSTMIARNDDSGGVGNYTAKKFIIIEPKDQSSSYTSVISHCKIKLPSNPMRISATPNIDYSRSGIWAACGVNKENVAMSATETITSNPRVLGADPLVTYQPANGEQKEVAGGIGEEDFVYIVLPYIHSAKDGVKHLGSLLEKYGTYEMNGIAFQDVNEIWWLETIGGHHWIARRVPDDVYVVMPNQLGLDEFDLQDALTTQENFMCSKDMKAFIEDNHLDLSFDKELNPRDAFGSHGDADHVYNTPRAWFMLRYFNPNTNKWDGPDADYKPMDDNLPWCNIPEKKITPEDIKYVLSSHYQSTPYDPYLHSGDESQKNRFRTIGINRTDFMGFVQIRPYAKKEYQAIEWVAFGSNAFNVMIPFYPLVDKTPDYVSNTTNDKVDTNNFYWSSRLIGAMADASYRHSSSHIERYQLTVQSKATALIKKYDVLLSKQNSVAKQVAIKEKANQEICDMVQAETDKTLKKVLDELTNNMKNAFSRSDA